LQHNLLQRQQTLDYCTVRLKNPKAIIEAQHYKLTHLRSRLRYVMTTRRDEVARQYQDLSQRLQLKSPLPVLTQQQHLFEQLRTR
ncbi:MAG: exodeoxyribonuclease VII large subunit, partial [Piscirickettsiaceae bacterium]|nr:exodeoxyribonuclease VII large subunit [Piscirickettsiaceae bacterium]